MIKVGARQIQLDFDPILRQNPILEGGSEVNLVWSTGNVALDHYLMPTMNNNSLIQIGGPEKGQCGTRTEANSARSCHEAPALTSQFSQQPKQQWEQELSSHHLELDASEVDVPVDNTGDISLIEEGEVPLSSVAFARAVSDSQ